MAGAERRREGARGADAGDLRVQTLLLAPAGDEGQGHLHKLKGDDSKKPSQKF